MQNKQLVALLQQLMAFTGAKIGQAIEKAIDDLVATENVDIADLQAKIETIQNILDADPSTPEFDQAQNIITSIKDILSRLTAVENTIATLEGDENVAGSIDSKIATERERAAAAEKDLGNRIDNNKKQTDSATSDLQSQIDSLSGGDSGSIKSVQDEIAAIQAGAGLEKDGSYVPDDKTNYIKSATSLKDADKKLDAAVKNLEDNKADKSEVVLASDIKAIDTSALGEIFLDALNCGLSGGKDCEKLKKTDNADSKNKDGNGDGAVL